MRTYLIILGHIPSEEHDKKFFSIVTENKFDYWRYTAFNWILATPDTISTNFLISKITEAYGAVFTCVMEIDIRDVGGIFPTNEPVTNQSWTPFQWFHKIKDPKFVPAWEKDVSKV